MVRWNIRVENFSSQADIGVPSRAGLELGTFFLTCGSFSFPTDGRHTADPNACLPLCDVPGQLIRTEVCCLACTSDFSLCISAGPLQRQRLPPDRTWSTLGEHPSAFERPLGWQSENSLRRQEYFF